MAATDGELPQDFDPAYYLLVNRDVAEAGQDPVEHYLLYGRDEGRIYSRKKPPAVAIARPPLAAPLSTMGREIEGDAFPLLAAIDAHLGSDELFKTVAVVGSAPSAVGVNALIDDQTLVVTLNNAWRAARRRDYVLYADDLPEASKPPLPERALRGRSSPQYWPAVNGFGGHLYCGASLAFSAGYWILRTLPFSQVSYFASDMIYTQAQNHFYGQGDPDPLRPDPSLQDHEAKSLRLFYFGLKNACLFLNGSAQPETRLAFPRVRSGASLARNVMRELVHQLATELRDAQQVAADAIALEHAADFEWRAPDHWRFMQDEKVWKHAAAVDERWRGLAPVAARIESAVNDALATSTPQRD